MEIQDVEARDEANPAFTQTNASHASAIALAFWARCTRIDLRLRARRPGMSAVLRQTMTALRPSLICNNVSRTHPARKPRMGGAVLQEAGHFASGLPAGPAVAQASLSAASLPRVAARPVARQPQAVSMNDSPSGQSRSVAMLVRS